MTRTSKIWILSIALLALGAPGSATAVHPLRGGGVPNFSDPLTITNPFSPFVPGGVKVFAGRSDGARTAIVDLYLTGTRMFSLSGGSVECHILQETEFEAGELSEISQNFFAQGDDGVGYYFGEIVDTYAGGVVTGHEGSWLVGGATAPGDPPGTGNATAPGVFMPANPAVGDMFKPEDVPGVVDETDTVLLTGIQVRVRAGTYDGAIKVSETSVLAPGEVEYKWYAPGVGVVKGRASGESFALLASTLTPP